MRGRDQRTAPHLLLRQERPHEDPAETEALHAGKRAPPRAKHASSWDLAVFGDEGISHAPFKSHVRHQGHCQGGIWDLRWILTFSFY